MSGQKVRQSSDDSFGESASIIGTISTDDVPYFLEIEHIRFDFFSSLSSFIFQSILYVFRFARYVAVYYGDF